MTKEHYLDLLRTISSLETWGFFKEPRMPDWLVENIERDIERIRAEILREQ